MSFANTLLLLTSPTKSIAVSTPTVTMIEQTYEKGVRLKPKEMDQFEAQVQRLSNQGQEEMPELGKWFVDISWDSA